MQVIKIGLSGSLGVILRYLISIIFSSSISVSICNLIGVFFIAKTDNLKKSQKEIFQTGFLGGFTSLSAIMVLKYSFIVLFINIILGIIIFKLVIRKK